jgi:hypothetical protein
MSVISEIARATHGYITPSYKSTRFNIKTIQEKM